MKRILLLLMLCPVISQAQELLKLTEEGVAPIVVQAEGKTAQDLYKKTIDWVNTYFVNPDKVLKGKVEGDYIRIEGFCDNCWSTKSLGIVNRMDYSYTLVIEFQEGKYRYAVTVDQLSSDGQKMMYTYKSFFNKKGIRSAYEVAHKEIEESLNKDFLSHQDYVLGKAASKKDW